MSITPLHQLALRALETPNDCPPPIACLVRSLPPAALKVLQRRKRRAGGRIARGSPGQNYLWTILKAFLSAVVTAGVVMNSKRRCLRDVVLRNTIALTFATCRCAVLPSKRTQKRKGIDLLNFCPQPPKLTTRAIMDAHAPANDDCTCPLPRLAALCAFISCSLMTVAAVSADADVLRLERENSSLLDEQVLCACCWFVLRRLTPLQQVARETMLALLLPDAVSSSTPTAMAQPENEYDRLSFQNIPCYDEFGNDEVETLRQTVADLHQQVAQLQSQLEKQRRGKAAKK